ncbi:MAG: hypothetical protein Q9159_003130 [Coniocarpon cinnabarinum]
MGRPRLIIVVRHAQSEGNRNRSIHQITPDHRVKLTQTGWDQAFAAGSHLRSMLHPDDTLQFFISPYRRTRETTDGILSTLTSDDPSPSPFPRHTINVWEEPRLREQDFGNFQPSSGEMERMWKERAEYGHFFYRIPSGESAADAYDRVSGFNESLWRQFNEADFPSVCVLVTHGLMTRVFLMKWYHWSVEYFEDLRNVGHCEFVVMERRDEKGGRYLLRNQMRTWSELKRAREDLHGPVEDIPKKRWGSSGGDSPSAGEQEKKRPKRQDTAIHAPLAPPDLLLRPTASEEDSEALPSISTTISNDDSAPSKPTKLHRSVDISSSDLPQRLRDEQKAHKSPDTLKPRPMWLQAGRDFGGSESGMSTPAAVDEQRGFDFGKIPGVGGERKGSQNSEEQRKRSVESGEEVKRAGRENTETMARADALGDQDEEEGDGLSDEERRDRSVRGSVY